MFAIAEETSFRNGEFVFKEGTYGDWIYIVVSGEVEISKYCQGQKVVIATLKENDIFGEMSFFGRTPRSASAIAKGDVCVGILDRDMLDQEFNKLSQDTRLILKGLVMRLRETTDRISLLTGRQEQRAAKALDIQFKTLGDFKKAYSVDIAGGGLQLRVDEPMTVGSECVVRFRIPGDEQPIQTNSQVVWSRLGAEGGKQTVTVGLKFIGISPRDRDRVNSYVGKMLESD